MQSLGRSKGTCREVDDDGKGGGRAGKSGHKWQVLVESLCAPAFVLHRDAGYPKVTSSSVLLWCYSVFLVPMQDNESHIHN